MHSSHRSSSGLIGLLIATFLALVWVMWSGLSVFVPESEEPACNCNPDLHLISHRGGASHAPENTMAAFRKALEISPDISMDLSVTLDGELVLMHDDFIDRTTDKHGLLCQMLLEEVQDLDAGSWFGNSFVGERVPTLQQVFEEFGNRTMYYMDLKKRKDCFSEREYTKPNSAHTPISIAQKVVHLVSYYNLENNVAFTVEDKEVLAFVKRKLPKATVLATINVLYTLAPLSSMWAFVDSTDADGVSAHFLMPMLKNVLAEAKKRKKKVYIYTVDSLYVSRWLECLGLDGIITNFPKKILSGSKCPIYELKPAASQSLFNEDRRNDTNSTEGEKQAGTVYTDMRRVGMQAKAANPLAIQNVGWSLDSWWFPLNFEY